MNQERTLETILFLVRGTDLNTSVNTVEDVRQKKKEKERERGRE